MRRAFHYAPYEETIDVPNIVVDGSPNKSTVLTLTHWPGIEQPPGLAADLSAQMAFNYLDVAPAHPSAAVVTNNHFDQDGLVGLHALIEPEISSIHRERLVDVAAAGDFGTYRFREAARASKAIWAYAQPETSPLGVQLEGPYEHACSLLYRTVLPLLVPMIEDPQRFKDLWQDEDAQLTASERAIDRGDVSFEEIADIDLAVVTINSDDLAGGHRFASGTVDMIHPFAVNNATSCSRLLLMKGAEYLYLDRYETWVQYQSRVLPKRVDMAPLCERLESLETGETTWTASRPSALTPMLRSDAESSLSGLTVRSTICDHLRSMPVAWNPFVPNQ